MTELRVTSASPESLHADVLVVGLATKDSGDPVVLKDSGLSSTSSRALARAFALVGARASIGATTRIPAPKGFAASSVMAVGCGTVDRSGPSAEELRRAAGSAMQQIESADKVAFALPCESADKVAAVAEGALLGAYRFESFRGDQSETAGRAEPARAVLVVAPEGRDQETRTAIRTSEALVRDQNWARDQVNTPPSAQSPAAFAAAAKSHLAGSGVRVAILDEGALVKGGFGGISAVGQGSANPPRLIQMSYKPVTKKPVPTVVLVGKGITFDSGGLSLKPASGMVTMKCDMAGAAAVVAAMRSIAELKLPVKVIAYATCAENMPSATAQRPGDVITIHGGKTVEVLNTDAEGRLVMADALDYCAKDGPDYLIDVATLTGAQVVALGHHVSAVMGNDEDLRTLVHKSGEETGEPFWPMPMPAELRPSLDSHIADIANIGERMGGMLTAALFLQEFVPDGVKWAHLDIAGPAFNTHDPHGYTPKGGTGVAVRTLVTTVASLGSQ